MKFIQNFEDLFNYIIISLFVNIFIILFKVFTQTKIISHNQGRHCNRRIIKNEGDDTIRPRSI